MSAPDLPEPGISPPGDGDEWRILGHSYWLRSWSEPCFVFETCDRPGTGIPAHVHRDLDELIYVVEGDVEGLEDLDEAFARSAAHGVEFVREV